MRRDVQWRTAYVRRGCTFPQPERYNQLEPHVLSRKRVMRRVASVSVE